MNSLKSRTTVHLLRLQPWERSSVLLLLGYFWSSIALLLLPLVIGVPGEYVWLAVLYISCLPLFWVATVLLSMRIIRRDRLIVFILIFSCLVPLSADRVHGAFIGHLYPETAPPLVTVHPVGRALASEPVSVDVTFTNRSRVDYYVTRGDGDLGIVPLGHWGEIINASYKPIPSNGTPQILTKKGFEKVGAGKSFTFN